MSLKCIALCESQSMCHPTLVPKSAHLFFIARKEGRSLGTRVGNGLKEGNGDDYRRPHSSGKNDITTILSDNTQTAINCWLIC